MGTDWHLLSAEQRQVMGRKMRGLRRNLRNNGDYI